MLLHVRIVTVGGGPTEEAAQRDLENSLLEKNRAIESLVDPSVDHSPNTGPNLTYCGRRVVYGGPERIERIHAPLPPGAQVCAACKARSAQIRDHEILYIRDDQTAEPAL
jgi:hypothetical protein